MASSPTSFIDDDEIPRLTPIVSPATQHPLSNDSPPTADSTHATTTSEAAVCLSDRVAALHAIGTPALCHTGDVISIELARKLRDAGLEWLPAEGDRFMIPDRGLDDHVFSISEMTVEVRRIAEQQRIMFNGSVEWALDSIVQSEVIWLPSETQLRDRLGRAFSSLDRNGDAFTCELTVNSEIKQYTADDPASAYALALLDLLDDPDTMLRLIVD